MVPQIELMGLPYSIVILSPILKRLDISSIIFLWLCILKFVSELLIIYQTYRFYNCYTFLLFPTEIMSSRVSIFNNSAIVLIVYKSGWEVLVHHLETVTGSLPNCSASHLPVWPVSANTAFILFSFFRSVFVSID